MDELRSEWIAELACEHAELGAFQGALLDGLGRHIGFDVAFFAAPSGLEIDRGLDASVRASAPERWASMAAETLDLLEPARRSGGVIVDSEWFGARLERLVYYETFMRPHQGHTTLMAFLESRGALHGKLVLGRCRGSSPFRSADVAALQRLAPVLSLSRLAYGEQRSPGALGTPRALRSRSAPQGRAAAASGARSSGDAELTRREREVLGYLPLGYTNQQIAAALGSAPRTVRNQLSHLYDKLGVGTRAEAVAWMLEQRARPTSGA